MSHIIFLNGCGSSGKTSIARSLQHLSKKPWLHLGMDMLIEMMSPAYIPGGLKAKTGYFSFQESENDRGPTMVVENGPLGPQVFGALPSIAKILADFGNDVILDEVLLDDEVLRSYVTALGAHTVYFIGIFCDFQQMQEREILRRDRALGLSNDQMDRVHKDYQDYYDLKINTTQRDPFECAKEILVFQEKISEPQGFKEFEKLYER
ncbi:MAG: hypothetical protein B7Y25_07200 [Alphaproteobacteria bacterium 16-39-46]|nr:MAG: hypothetical protein B7Y25_07200 [Alphaproteobacteria bacterium 16-39-46]OZA41794.1 MAG: hypothetical protein B7X84_07355 [Alphaproteobacteria bacterium 17-39-52]HQS84695.1 hypothetical protein [Alphaproteobacteria bacterium]HQS94516.1 hypothetical protein [Alphaproteobacteria bacterium]